MEKKQQEKKQEQPEQKDKIESLLRKLRLLEERYSLLRKKIQVIEQNFIRDFREMFNEMNVLNDTISELKREINEITDKLTKLSEEVNLAVKKSEFNVLAKYIEFWQPLNFLTRKEAEKILKEKNKTN